MSVPQDIGATQGCIRVYTLKLVGWEATSRTCGMGGNAAHGIVCCVLQLASAHMCCYCVGANSRAASTRVGCSVLLSCPRALTCCACCCLQGWRASADAAGATAAVRRLATAWWHVWAAAGLSGGTWGCARGACCSSSGGRVGQQLTACVLAGEASRCQNGSFVLCLCGLVSQHTAMCGRACTLQACVSPCRCSLPCAGCRAAGV